MSAPPATTPPALPQVYEAMCATDGSDNVDRGALLSRQQAEDRRRAEQDIVVCGPDTPLNCELARQIEQAVTLAGLLCLHHGPHRGPQSLPHWQQQRNTPPEGHSFYETHIRKARVTP